MMRRTDYLQELTISGTQKRGGTNRKKEVEKIQEWLCLHGFEHPSWGTITSVDGDFGPATQRAVKNFQRHKGLTQSGEVNKSLFKLMSSPLKNAFEGVEKQSNLRKTIVTVASKHVAENSRELYYKGGGNKGPWVRSYMKGNQGSAYAWCAGFVSSVMDQSFDLWGKNANIMAPYTWGCDQLAGYAKRENAFIPYERYRSRPSMVQAGDIFLIRKTSTDWIHTGIVSKVSGDVFTTIEGNTNEGGSRNGYGTLERVRNFKRQKLDIFSVSKWAGQGFQPDLHTVKLHSRGETVKFLEEELVKKGYDQVVVSHYFGISTDAAVKDFQRKKRLVVDGIVGPKTWAALL